MKRMFNRMGNKLTMLLLSGAVVLAGTAVAFTQKSKTDTKAALNLPVDERPITRDLGGRASFSPVVKKVAPGVVKVFTTTRAHNAAYSGPSGPSGPSGMDDMLRRFFGDDFEGRMPKRNQTVPRQQGIGSGVIVTKDGFILTNNHVVDGADEVKVAMQDGREFTAKVIGRDPKSDVAVVKIDAKDLPVVPMADSDKVEVGDVVLAVGNPFGIGQTVTTGIVSATGRGGALGLDYEDFIQTDAAINPGNSGGALVDAEGRLIGINTAILSRSGGNQGIGFAIPANLARDVMTGLVRDGRVTRGYAGMWIQDVTPVLAKEFKLKEHQGALVGDVAPKSPAEKAGLQNGDVILEYNGKKVTDSRHLKLEVARTQPGETVPLKVMRDGSSKTIDLKVKELPGSEQLAKNDKSSKSDDTGTLNGVTVSDLDPQARKQFELPGNVVGVVVTDVAPDSAAAEAGIKPGDVIQEIDHKRVKTAEEAVRMTEKTDSKSTLLRVWSGGGSHYVVVDETNKQG
jgi:serine protease Do